MQSSIFYRRIVIILAILGIFFPVFFTHAEIYITEIAWMGTDASQYEEWVELYNDGSDEVVLDGWKLFKTGGVALFSLKGTISASSYYLVCRSTASLQNPLNGICQEQGVFGGSGLNNTSDQILLKDTSDITKDSIDATAGWPAGNTSTKQTMQKLNNEWITAVPTPGSETVTNSGEGGSEPEDDSDGESQQGNDPKEKIELVQPDPVYKAHMIIPDFATAGIAIPMKASVVKDAKSDLIRGRFEWSMGDGGSYKFLKNNPLQHTYFYPGTYTVVMQYYSDIFREEPDTIHRKTITIVPSDIQILGYSYEKGLEIKNESSKEIALDGWIIQSGGDEFVFPRYTTIPKGATLALSPKVLGIPIARDRIVLLNPSRETISKYNYRYIPPETIESFSDTPDYSQNTLETISSVQVNTQQEKPPKIKTLSMMWDDNKWYIIFGIALLVVFLAYIGFHLYAKSSDELELL